MTELESRDPHPAPPRRTMLKGAAVLGAAIPFLAACGSDDDPAATGSETSSGGGTTGSTGGGNNGGGDLGDNGGGAAALTTTGEIPEGGGIILENPGIVITQPAAGTFEGFSNICKHAGCVLASVSDGLINCDCHGSQYSIADGSPVTGPNGQPASTISALDPKPVKVSGKNITLA